MDSPNQPPWPPPPPREPGGTFNPRNTWQEARRRVTGSYGPDPDQRIGDAERSEMADVLGKHYSDGRLDESEFRERLDQAMSAKTRGDLSGLLSDLPPLGQTQVVPPPPPPRAHRRARTLLLVLLGIVFFTSLGSALWPYHVPWLLIALVAFLVLRRHHWHGHGRHHGWDHDHHGPARWDNPPPPQTYAEGGAGRPPWI